MGKKKSMARPVASDSFQNLVANTASKQMEAFLEQKIQMYASAIKQEIASLVLKHTANIQTRQLALEELFNKKGMFQDGELEEAITKQEDSALGMVEADKAQAGDCVRIQFQYMKDGKPSETERLRITSLLREVEGRVQTDLNLEQALVGMAKNETKTIKLEAAEEGAEAVEVSFTVFRVSRTQEKTEV
jgi:hypothetical protein